ncbi:hypothetical protein HDU89_003217 [Geranomyces variabilis]|nr:hypothetical protein HDU89_003217 [Geranomyces variabilis]
MLTWASDVDKGELCSIMEHAKLQSCEMERRYAGFFAELYDTLGGGFLIVAAKDLVGLQHTADVRVYDKAIRTIFDSIIADDQLRVDAALQAFEDLAAQH